jgi:hypothetical protein
VSGDVDSTRRVFTTYSANKFDVASPLLISRPFDTTWILLANVLALYKRVYVYTIRLTSRVVFP